MALAVDSTGSGTSATSPLSFSFTNTAGNVLYVATATGGGTGIASITYNGVNLTQAVQSGNDDGRSEYWYLGSPATGANTLVVTGNASQTISACVITFTGGNPSDPVGTVISGTSGGANQTSASLTVNTVGDSGYVIDGIRIDDQITSPGVVTIGGSQTLQAGPSGGTGANVRLSSQSFTGSSNPVMSWSWVNGVRYSDVAIEVKPAATTSPSDLLSFF